MNLPGNGMTWKEFFSDLKTEVSRDNMTSWAGAVTYSGLLALFPFMLFLLALASVIIQPAQAEALVDELGKVAPAEVTKILGDRIRALGQGSSPGLLTIGGIGAIWAASGGIQAIMTALNVAYGVRESRPFWKVKGIAILMTLVAGVLALVAALVAIASPAIANFIGGPIGTAISWLRLPAAGLVMMLLWAILYYVLPDVQQKFKFITPGSVGGVVLWVLASYGFSQYVANFGKYDATYGSVGGIIVMLLWLWISSVVLLLGAEANAIIEHRSPEGKVAGAKSMKQKGVSGPKHEELGPVSASQATSEGDVGKAGPARGGRRPRRSARDGRPQRPEPAWRKVLGRQRGGHPRMDWLSIAALGAGALIGRNKHTTRH
ncbi:MAG TPA: YihY/virulence factor BrkB family protein [Anaeromyxobacteraceae bacterium]|nr:YihY/virulence factor BrkB family protein [Anaeromyxobacteraceae bacterium]